jgi:hypothetical protein
MKWTSRIKMVPTTTVPQTRVAGGLFLALAGGGAPTAAVGSDEGRWFPG